MTRSLPERWRAFRFRWWHETVLVVLLAGLLVVAGRLDPTFVRPATQVELSTHAWELAILAIGVTPVIITGGIDLSVGSTLSLCAVVLGLSFEAGLSPWLGAGLALLAGLAAGALNGWFVTRTRVHPLIVTLATLAAYHGVAEGISLGRPISGFPDTFTHALGKATPAGLPVPAWIVLALALLASLYLLRTAAGRFTYAIGCNDKACRFSGVPVDRILLRLYAVSGLLAGLAAVLFVARRNTAKADVGAGLELTAITAVVLGGTSINGGRGHILGTLLGVLLIHETREFVGWQWNRDELNFIVIGALLIASVVVHQGLSRRREA